MTFDDLAQPSIEHLRKEDEHDTLVVANGLIHFALRLTRRDPAMRALLIQLFADALKDEADVSPQQPVADATLLQ
jgi:hypothetical protein